MIRYVHNRIKCSTNYKTKLKNNKWEQLEFKLN